MRLFLFDKIQTDKVESHKRTLYVQKIIKSDANTILISWFNLNLPKPLAFRPYSINNSDLRLIFPAENQVNCSIRYSKFLNRFAEQEKKLNFAVNTDSCRSDYGLIIHSWLHPSRLGFVASTLTIKVYRSALIEIVTACIDNLGSSYIMHNVGIDNIERNFWERYFKVLTTLLQEILAYPRNFSSSLKSGLNNLPQKKIDKLTTVINAA